MDSKRAEGRGFIPGTPYVGAPKELRYTKVAFVATGKGEHLAAAQELAVRLTDKSAIKLTPLNEVTENLRSGRYDLVVAGSEEPWGIRDTLLGNSERTLVRNCPNDVLIVRHRPTSSSRRIVVAISPDSIDDRHTRLASETIQAATTFARWEDCELHVVNVVPSKAYYMLALSAGLSAYEARGIEGQARMNQRNKMELLLERLAVDRHRMTVHLRQGNPVQKIANLVTYLDADLLVIGSIGRKGIGRWLIGNTAEKVMRQVATSCLVVKSREPFDSLAAFL